MMRKLMEKQSKNPLAVLIANPNQVLTGIPLAESKGKGIGQNGQPEKEGDEPRHGDQVMQGGWKKAGILTLDTRGKHGGIMTTAILDEEKQKVEKVVGWARNHYLCSFNVPSVSNGRLLIPCESLEIAISRLQEHESISMKAAESIKNLAKDEYENNFVSAIVPSDEIRVKFDDIGAPEDMKRTLNELVTLPMRRPELFSQGILLFGPPKTSKTLLSKSHATEAGANFINITKSTLTSKWFGEAEKFTMALFSFESRRMQNEFIIAWMDSQRILILGATNRSFDLDDVVTRHLLRRIYVDLKDAEICMKIFKIFLIDELANVTEGYSGSYLKNICVAAAYRTNRELLEKEKSGEFTKQKSTLANTFHVRRIASSVKVDIMRASRVLNNIRIAHSKKVRCGLPFPAHRGPHYSFRGKVILTFEENESSKIGVRFDKQIVEGNNLGGLCEEDHRFFCTADCFV
ncbi:hypothetical protein M5K25_017104 [Dendrobium thyrsiflorum]|uniref:Uncharacterized protein n=1 Tax=Dendrobium thyrsiflorum TaxID=117978 RepID=A0ABD0UTC2_DENTH